MKVRILVVGQLQTNCYLVIDEHSSSAVIVDPGDDADYINSVVAYERAKPQAILATHGHFDHIMVAYELQLALNIPFMIHPKDEFLLKRMRQSAKYFTGMESGPPPKINGHLKNRQQINIGDISFKVLETPGHTPGSVCFYNRNADLVLSGDLLFAGGGEGRTDFAYSRILSLKKSLQKIMRLPEDTTFYPGHGPETSIRLEQRYHL